MKLEDLAKFRADRIEFHGEEAHLFGRFDKVPVIYGERSWLLNASVSYCGDILEVDPSSGLAMFRAWDHEFVPELFETGLSWMYGNYDAAAVWKVLDERSVWKEIKFGVSDALITTEDGYRVLRPANELDLTALDELGSDRTILSGGWDHEHCFICHEQINEDQPRCFQSEYGKGTFWWACVSCYQRWITIHDIGFLVWDHTGN